MSPGVFIYETGNPRSPLSALSFWHPCQLVPTEQYRRVLHSATSVEVGLVATGRVCPKIQARDLRGRSGGLTPGLLGSGNLGQYKSEQSACPGDALGPPEIAGTHIGTHHRHHRVLAGCAGSVRSREPDGRALCRHPRPLSSAFQTTCFSPHFLRAWRIGLNSRPFGLKKYSSRGGWSV
jgi:hypothetical protein